MKLECKVVTLSLFDTGEYNRSMEPTDCESLSKELNAESEGGWRVVSVVGRDGEALVFMERSPAVALGWGPNNEQASDVLIAEAEDTRLRVDDPVDKELTKLYLKKRARNPDVLLMVEAISAALKHLQSDSPDGLPSAKRVLRNCLDQLG